VAGGYYVRGDIADILQALTHVLGVEVGKFLKRIHDAEEQVRKSVARVTAVNKVEAAKILGLSVAGIGRQVKKKALRVIYIDSRPRFRLKELERFLDAHEKSEPRRRKRKKSASGEPRQPSE
jgi:hypothetical protein